MEDFWILFCGESVCSDSDGKPCSSAYVLLSHPNSCINHALIICFDVVLLLTLLVTMIQKLSSKLLHIPARFHRFTSLQIVAAVINGCLGLVYLCLGVWILVEKLIKTQTALPLNRWLLVLLQGVTWLLVSLTVSLRQNHLPRASIWWFSVLTFLFGGIVCILSICAVISRKGATVKTVLDVVSFPGAILLLFCAYKRYNHEQTDAKISYSCLYAPLNGKASGISKDDYVDQITGFAKAGFLSKMYFWWLIPLMKRGREKTLGDEDMPVLREADRAESCYLRFLDQLNKQKQRKPSSQPSILKTILICHWREIFTSGFFALLKVLTISAGPLLLNAFILVAEGSEGFKYEGYVLAILLFLAKNLESLSQRQWYFRSRLIGLKVRSLLSAAIYMKQLRLSNAARLMHSGGETMNYVTVDAYRIGEFPFWFHQTWTTSLQLCIALVIMFRVVGLATLAALVVIIITVICNAPLSKLQYKFQRKLMVATDARLKACNEAIMTMKALKLYAWETHFKNAIQNLRKVEYKWLSAFQMRKAYDAFLFWTSPVLISAATFGACYFLMIPLSARSVFTFVATLRLVQDPIRLIPDVITVFIQANVSFSRIVKFLEAPELQSATVRQKCDKQNVYDSISIKSAHFLWEENSLKPTLQNISLEVRNGEKVAICGEVGSGKSTLLAAILGEVPNTQGTLGSRREVYRRTFYLGRRWIAIDTMKHLKDVPLVKDLELLPYGDQTEIGERGVNLSGGQKQRIQLARALYKNADIYLLDDPFSAVDAHTASSLFNDYVMEALSEKSVLVVTHQVDFLPAFDSVLLMSDGEILQAAPYHELLASSNEFLDLVNAHKETAGSERLAEVTTSQKSGMPVKEIKEVYVEKQFKVSKGNQVIKEEERETGDTGFEPYIKYLNQSKGFLFFSLASLTHVVFLICQISQNSWMASNVENPNVSTLQLIVVYLLIAFVSTLFVLCRCLFTVVLGLRSSESLFSQLLNSFFHAPMSFYDSTPMGRILSRVASDLSIVDLDVPFNLIVAVVATTVTYGNLGVLVVITWQVLLISIPVVYVIVHLQRYYFSTSKELMRINGTTKSFIANHLAESITGAMTIRAFEEEERFFAKNLAIIDTNASPFFHCFAANEWLIQRLETLSGAVIVSAAFCMVLLPPGTFTPGFIGMALSYGLALNGSLVNAIQYQCTLANYIISVERLNQYMHIPSEAPEVIEDNRPPSNWPAVGKVDICDLQIRYRPDTPLVLRGISCTFEGGHKIGIVGRTGSGKTTLIGALFRLVEPDGGKIIVDGIDISKIGLHDLRSRFGIIPQDSTLFSGTVRYNLDPLSQHTDQEIWEVLEKCQLLEVVQGKEQGLDSLVMEDGTNWSMGQRQLFCLGRALLKRSRILVLDEATASIDNATDMILQKTIRAEFSDCTVVTVAHRIPTVMDCSMILVLSDGNLVEYGEPMKLMKEEGSLFGLLVNEYWSRLDSAESH